MFIQQNTRKESNMHICSHSNNLIVLDFSLLISAYLFMFCWSDVHLVYNCLLRSLD